MDVPPVCRPAATTASPGLASDRTRRPLSPGFPRWIDRNGMIRACFPCNARVSSCHDRSTRWVIGENKHFVFNSLVGASFAKFSIARSRQVPRIVV